MNARPTLQPVPADVPLPVHVGSNGTRLVVVAVLRDTTPHLEVVR